jgi:hypothetical protein
VRINEELLERKVALQVQKTEINDYEYHGGSKCSVLKQFSQRTGKVCM